MPDLLAREPEAARQGILMTVRVARRSTYDRQLLLLGALRNQILALSDVERYGIDSYGDADYVSVYGLRPAAWFAQGVRLMGRTAVECTRDALAQAIAHDVAAVAGGARHDEQALLLDPFAGSGNTLYWLMRRIPGAQALGFELDPAVFRLTQQNFAALGAPIDIRNADYRSGIAGTTVPARQPVIAFIAPPWGDALDATSGLDLRRTDPPIAEIVDFLLRAWPDNPILCAIQIYEKVNPESLVQLEARFDATRLRVYTLNEPGWNHGLLLGSRRWTPQRAFATDELVREP